jgi:hypothetical protein
MTTVLVIGATGKVGRYVVSGLLDEGVAVRALARHPETSALPAQVEVVEGDVGRLKTIESAARGAQSAFLLWPGFYPAGARQVVAALAGSVDHIVQLSSARLQGEETGVTEGVWAEVERLVQASGVPGRSSRRAASQRTLSAGRTRSAPEARCGSRSRERRGPWSTSATSRKWPYVRWSPAAIIGQVVGRAVAVEEKSADDARREFASFMGPDAADRAVAHWTTLVDSPERATRDVERITGHPARTYAAWVRDHLDAFTPPVREGRI